MTNKCKLPNLQPPSSGNEVNPGTPGFPFARRMLETIISSTNNDTPQTLAVLLRVVNLLSVLGCLFVVLTYLLFPPLRRQNSHFTLWIALMGGIFHSIVLIDTQHEPNDCCEGAPLIQFSLLTQEFFFFVLAFNFYYTTKYPFHSTRLLSSIYYFIVVMIAGILTTITSLIKGVGEVTYYGFCWYSGEENDTETILLLWLATPICFGYIISIFWYIIATKRIRKSRGRFHTSAGNAQTTLDQMRQWVLCRFAYWWIVAIPFLLRRELVKAESPLAKNAGLFGGIFLGLQGTILAILWAKSAGMRNAYSLWRKGNWDEYMKIHEATWILRRQILYFATKGIQASATLAGEVREMSAERHSNTIRMSRWSGFLMGMTTQFRGPSVNKFQLEGSSTNQKAIFKDFQPQVFHEIRRMSGITSESYVQSFAGRTREKFSEGKSGSFLYYTGDQLFILKTCTPAEQRYLLQILPQYVTHLKENPNSHLCRYVGCHELIMEHHSVLFIVLTNMLTNTSAVIDEYYDLKGSWDGRYKDLSKNGTQRVCKYCGRDFIVGMSKEMCRKNPNMVNGHAELVIGKDLNWSCRKLNLPRDFAMELASQLKADSEFLNRIHSMDYSLIIGLSSSYDGNSDTSMDDSDPRDQIKQSPPPRAPNLPVHPRLDQIGDAYIMSFEETTDYAVLGANDTCPRHLNRSNAMFPVNSRAVNMGIIDILTPWSIRKKMEHWMRVFFQCRDPTGISCVEPTYYADRFRKRVVDTVILGDDEHYSQPCNPHRTNNELVKVDFTTTRTIPFEN